MTGLPNGRQLPALRGQSEWCYPEEVRPPLPAVLASWWLLPALTAPGAESVSPPPPPADTAGNRTLSESGQFWILGGSSAARTDLAKRSDRLWRLFTATTGLPSNWQHRIVVQIHDRANSIAPARRAVGGFRPIEGGGYRFQVDIIQDEDFRWDEYRRELTKLFLLSQTIAANPNREVRYRVPPWMTAGLHTLLSYRQNGLPEEFFSALLHTRHKLSLGEVLKASTSQFQDSVSSGIFSAGSAVLIQALLDQPNGRARFRALLSDLGTTERDSQELLRQHFPSLSQDPNELEAWWVRQMESMGKRDRYAVLPLSETEKRLEDILIVRPPPPKPGTVAPPPTTDQPQPSAPKPSLFSRFRKSPNPSNAAPEVLNEAVHLRSWERYLNQPWAKAALSEKQAQLTVLQGQAFPLYHAILAGYLQAIVALENGQTKGVAEQLDRLDQERQAVQAQMRGVEDHINWFSATQIEGGSREFDGYSQALRLLEKLNQRQRPDPVSRYLDAIERELNP